MNKNDIHKLSEEAFFIAFGAPRYYFKPQGYTPDDWYGENTQIEIINAVETYKAGHNEHFDAEAAEIVFRHLIAEKPLEELYSI